MPSRWKWFPDVPILFGRRRRAVATLFAIVVIGSTVVYLPVLAVTWLTEGDFGWLGITVITALMPLLAWGVCHYSARLQATKRVASFIPVAIVFGIWATGPLWLLGRSILQEGSAFAFRDAVPMLRALPLVAITSATYDGSLFGLILASLVVWFPNSAWRDV